MIGYNVKTKQKQEFNVENIRQLKNGAYLATGKTANGDKMSKILSKLEAQQYKK